MLFSLPRKRGINIAKIRGNKVTDYRSGIPTCHSFAFAQATMSFRASVASRGCIYTNTHLRIDILTQMHTYTFIREQ